MTMVVVQIVKTDFIYIYIDRPGNSKIDRVNFFCFCFFVTFDQQAICETYWNQSNHTINSKQLQFAYVILLKSNENGCHYIMMKSNPLCECRNTKVTTANKKK